MLYAGRKIELSDVFAVVWCKECEIPEMSQQGKLDELKTLEKVFKLLHYLYVTTLHCRTNNNTIAYNTHLELQAMPKIYFGEINPKDNKQVCYK